MVAHVQPAGTGPHSTAVNRVDARMSSRWWAHGTADAAHVGPTLSAHAGLWATQSQRGIVCV